MTERKNERADRRMLGLQKLNSIWFIDYSDWEANIDSQDRDPRLCPKNVRS